MDQGTITGGDRRFSPMCEINSLFAAVYKLGHAVVIHLQTFGENRD
jgi:hypothetical protein